jgi:repressor LexA
MDGVVSMPLTPRQTSVLTFLREFIAVKGYSPSVREVASWLGVTHQAAECHLAAIERKGAIRRDAHIARSIRVVA